MDAPPPDDAYGRVTDPQRYRVVHDAADRLIGDLVDRYDVTIAPGDATDLERRGTLDLARVVRLVPAREDAARLTVGFTAFPGVLVRFGRWHVQAFPSCGCDACDEHPEQVVADLHDHVTALVDGRFTEQLVGRWRPWRTAEFIGPDGGWHRSSSERLPRTTHRRLVGRGPTRRDWQPWPPRAVR